VLIYWIQLGNYQKKSEKFIYPKTFLFYFNFNFEKILSKENSEKLDQLIEESKFLAHITNPTTLKSEKDLAVKRLIEILKDECLEKMIFCQLNCDTVLQNSILTALYKGCRRR
jgi:hypothetical protein